jgi:hypothetical protein
MMKYEYALTVRVLTRDTTGTASFSAMSENALENKAGELAGK